MRTDQLLAELVGLEADVSSLNGWVPVFAR